MSSDDGFSVRGIALALERPQAAADHGEKVVDVVDDELRHLRYRFPPLLPARGDRATRVGPRASVAQNPRYLAVGPDERDLHAPGRNDAATAIADAPAPLRWTHTALQAQRAALSTSTTTSFTGGLSAELGNETPIVSLICMSDLLACDRSTERRLRPPTRGRATMGCKLSSRRLKGKLPLAMELIGDRYRNR
jgi:hypothetical protein